MAGFILITFVLLTKVCILVADHGSAIMRCDDNTTVKIFNYCIPGYDCGISISCEMNSDLFRSNHGFKVYGDDGSVFGNDGVSQTIRFHNDFDRPRSIRYQCVRYNNTADGRGTVEKVCSDVEVRYLRCSGPQAPTELVAQEAEDVTLHCLDSPEDADIQWYFIVWPFGGSKLLSTGYTINLRNLTGQSSGWYTCAAVKNTSNVITAYGETYKLTVKEHFRRAFVDVRKREDGSFRFECMPLGITSPLHEVNVSKWIAQYTSLNPGQYNQWSTVEADGDNKNLYLTGLAPSTWYLMKGQVTDRSGKTVPMMGVFFSTYSSSDQSPEMDILSSSEVNDTFRFNMSRDGYIDHEDMKRLSVMEGDDAVIECGFNMDHLTAHFDFEANWTRRYNENLPKDSLKYKRMNRSLVIRDLSLRDAGDYRCLLTATPKSANAGFTKAYLKYLVIVYVTKPIGVLLPPLEVKCVNITATTVTMSWSGNPNNTDIKGYKVQYWMRATGDATAEKTEVFLPKNAQGTRNEFTGLQPRTAYGFKIRAVGNVGYKGDAAMKSCATL